MVLALAVGAAWAPACKGQVAAPAAEASQKKVTLVLDGTTCEGCATHIQEALAKVDGVIEAKASHANARAWVTYDEAKVQVPAIIGAIEKAGYKARIASESEAASPEAPAAEKAPEGAAP